MQSYAEKAQPGVTIALGVHTFDLRFTLLSFCKLRILTGKEALAGDAFDLGNSFELGALLWAAILPSHPQVSFDDVVNMVQPDQVDTITDAVKVALERSAIPSDKKKL